MNDLQSCLVIIPIIFFQRCSLNDMQLGRPVETRWGQIGRRSSLWSDIAEIFM
jgi:hypothetical protein